jgi:hypothetical protein
MTQAGTALDATATLGRLLVESTSHCAVPATERAQRPVLDHLAIAGSTGEYLVPVGRRSRAVRPLVAYRRLRPIRPRVGRLAVAAAVGVGLGRLVGARRSTTAGPGDRLLTEHLASELGEPGLLFAATARPCEGFVTPVLQLLRPDGRTVGFAKLGWDAVTDAMVRNEHDALVRVGRAAPDGLAVPAVRWAGEWNGHAVLVTAPMPARVTRLRDGSSIPVEPLRALAEVDAAPRRVALASSDLWRAARETIDAAPPALSGDLARRLDDAESEVGAVEVELGRAHGDWVVWNLARDGATLHAWDWAYSCRGVPFGLDVLHYPYLREVVVGGRSRADALATAEAAARPAFDRLGIGSDARRALSHLLPIDLDLRDLRAAMARRADGGAEAVGP